MPFLQYGAGARSDYPLTGERFILGYSETRRSFGGVTHMFRTLKSVGEFWCAARAFVTAMTAIFCALFPQSSRADQGGIGFWLPGTFGSLAATPMQPGLSMSALYLHSSVSAGGDVAASRTINFPPNRPVNLSVNLDAEIKGTADVVAFGPTYVFATPVLGGQFAITALGIAGRQQATIDATVTGALGPIGFAAARSISDSRTAFGDVFLQPTLRWNQGVNNYLVYGMMNLPVGAYDPSRLANLGLGHWSIDGGAGYTYFDPKTGWEFSAVAGVTYNFTNPYLDYQNGIDGHLDWGFSKFVSKQVHIGLVGYAYQQLTADSGAGATLGDFKSRVFAVGPQIGYLFPVGDLQGYLNLKGYKEFGAEHRPEGWNAWLTLAISPSEAKASPPVQRMITK